MAVGLLLVEERLEMEGFEEGREENLLPGGPRPFQPTNALRQGIRRGKRSVTVSEIVSHSSPFHSLSNSSFPLSPFSSSHQTDVTVNESRRRVVGNESNDH